MDFGFIRDIGDSISESIDLGFMADIRESIVDGLNFSGWSSGWIFTSILLTILVVIGFIVFDRVRNKNDDTKNIDNEAE